MYKNFTMQRFPQMLVSRDFDDSVLHVAACQDETNQSKK